MGDKKKILEKARKTFGKQSRSARHEYKILLALYFTNAFHFSTPSVLDCLTQNRKRGFAKNLVEKGLLIERNIQSFLPYFPKKVLVLSKQGREFLLFKLPNISVWEGKTAEGHIFHDYLVQIITLHKLKPILKDYYQSFFIEKEPKYTNKTYDSYLSYKTKNMKTDKKIGIEVDLTRKKIRETHNALYNIYLDLQNNLADKVYFIFPKQHHELFQNQYEQVMNEKVFLYEKDRYNKYEKTFKNVQYLEEDKEKIHFEVIDIPPQICPKPPAEEEILYRMELNERFRQDNLIVEF